MGRNDIRLQIIAGEGSSGPVYRVVAQSPSMNSRSLLQRMRARGFVDAWHVTDPGLAAVSPRPRSAQSTSMPPAPAPSASGSEFAATPASSPALQVIASTEAAAPMPAMSDFAGPGPQRVFDTEAGVDLHELKIQTIDHETAQITVDGRIDEAIWRGIPYYDNMGVSIPDLGTDAEFSTKMRMFATEKGFYISADMEQPLDTLVERLTRRDDWVDRDLFGVTIDASGEGSWDTGFTLHWATA